MPWSSRKKFHSLSDISLDFFDIDVLMQWRRIVCSTLQQTLGRISLLSDRLSGSCRTYSANEPLKQVRSIESSPRRLVDLCWSCSCGNRTPDTFSSYSQWMFLSERPILSYTRAAIRECSTYRALRDGDDFDAIPRLLRNDSNANRAGIQRIARTWNKMVFSHNSR